MELRQALEANDLAEIKAKAKALEQAAQPLAQAHVRAGEPAGRLAAPGGDGEAAERATTRSSRMPTSR